MKTGMLKLWNSGVLDFVGVPRITVHDELGFSQRDESQQTIEAFDFIKHTMEGAIPLRVPVKVDSTTGPTWGEAK
jgi:DNA polymerase I-like protein with 3'-5' exonuclease and polymerase domains